MKILSFRPSDNEIEYKVTISTFNRKAKNTDRTLDYIMQVKKQKDTFSNYVINFTRNDLKLDNKLSHNLIDELILNLGSVMNNLILTISPYGEIKSINNIEKIKEDWEFVVKYRASKTYQGDIVGRMIENIEQKINDQELFIKYIHKDPFFHNYLSTIYGEYDNNSLKRARTIKLSNAINDIKLNTVYHLDENERKIKTVTGRGKIDENQIAKLKLDHKLEDINFIENSSYILTEEKFIDSIDSTKEFYLNQEIQTREHLIVKLM